ncbi:MAG: hypothetical protein JNM95_08675 [Chitinophagaceae bacterium]|nr:hypothetical protein [Chitinophagaceae bacterium]
MPTVTLNEIIERGRGPITGFYIVLNVLTFLVIYLAIQHIGLPWFLVCLFAAIFFVGCIGFWHARFYHWLFMNDVAPSRLLHSFKTRRFVETQGRIWLARLCAFGIIRREIKVYHQHIRDLDWSKPFQDSIPIEEEYNFDKVGFFNSTENFLCLNKDGIRYNHSTNTPWDQMKRIQINNQQNDDDTYFVEITKTNDRSYTLDITKVDTDFVKLELILKTMHQKYTNIDATTL